MKPIYRYTAEEQQQAIDNIAVKDGGKPGEMPKSLYFYLGSKGQKAREEWPKASLEDRVSSMAVMIGSYQGKIAGDRHVITHGYECLCRTGHLTAAAARQNGEKIETDHDITYEGESGMGYEPKWRALMKMPGEKVRIDENSRFFDPESLPPFRYEAATISKAIVLGEDNPTHDEPERIDFKMQYEFEGVDGRHDARQFMEEGGRENLMGVLLIENNEMWLTRFAHEDVFGDLPPGELPYAEGLPMRVGAICEELSDRLLEDGILPSPDDGKRGEEPGIEAYDGRFIPFSSFDGTFMKEGMLSSFDIQQKDGYEQEGPIRLLSSEDITFASPAFVEASKRAVGKLLALEERDPVNVLVDEMEGKSKVWRAEQENGAFSNDPTPRLADTATATKAAEKEANYLMRGHDVADANVRMAAAMVATENRPTEDGLGVSVRKLADSLAPQPVRSKGLEQPEENFNINAALRQALNSTER
ncbi:MAG: hypothetical protein CL472_08270 [Acidobacteria bacterium]|nr:hypothetical protein [Acidobacteriota bacterium]